MCKTERERNEVVPGVIQRKTIKLFDLPSPSVHSINTFQLILPSKALAQYSPGVLLVSDDGHIGIPFPTTCLEHLRVQSSYFAIVQPLTPVHLFGYHFAAYFQHFSLQRVSSHTHRRSHTDRCFQQAWKGRGEQQNPPRLLISRWLNLFELIRINIIYNQGEILFERCPRSKILN